jgi:PIN domain nuclease of toxin-antitoxin system
MKLLLDTVTFLDAAFAPADLSRRAKDLLQDPEGELFVSVASCWEIAIKYASGKLRLPEAPARFVPANREKLGTEILPIDEESALHVALLPDIHADPFDRILISQAIVHGMLLLTPDQRIAKYPVRSAW